mmetsp:Transcript_12137/g.18317  ORF Transcript_12137/g.18317 Transcript_12137/m.18317 type:complete len:115 (-) Transcript_12137:1400-1744(-)
MTNFRQIHRYIITIESDREASTSKPFVQFQYTWTDFNEMPSHIRCISEIYRHHEKEDKQTFFLSYFVLEKKAVSQTIAFGSAQQMEAPPIITSGSSSSSLPSMTKHVRMTKASK